MAIACLALPGLEVLTNRPGSPALPGGALAAQAPAPIAPRPNPREWSSGGRLIPEQRAYDVTYYDLAFRVDPADSTLQGDATIHARVVAPLRWIVVDLDSAFTVDRVTDRDGAALPFEHRRLRLWIRPAAPLAQGQTFAVRIRYGGQPRVAARPPWIGGFQWARTPNGDPWIATTTVNEGADLFWPVKDHPSDKADSVRIRITVPRGLVAASNGRPLGVDRNDDGTATWNWLVSTPISNYNVALNIGPYREVTRRYPSVAGDTIPVTYWVLPENVAQGEKLADEILDHLRFYENLLGPYPFRADKYGVVETPHLGMEHQTIIAYGNRYQANRYGFDELHQHELAHEWFGNLITARDWSDYWLHEGFGTYMQPLYVERTRGPEAYREMILTQWKATRNRRPVAEPGPLTAGEVYFNPPDFLAGDGDIYGKGSVVLHTLRFLVGDSLFFPILRRWLYPTPAAERVTDGSQVRLVSTDEFVAHASRMARRDLKWFFDVYVRQPELPRLEVTRSGRTLRLRWKAPKGLPFPMPIEVEVDGVTRRIPMPGGAATVRVAPESRVAVDPGEWVFRVR